MSRMMTANASSLPLAAEYKVSLPWWGVLIAVGIAGVIALITVLIVRRWR